ncbi:sugar-binding transcriptional regulator [Nigerium massiliense]|uniref:sugar-binding transcriptional regulator n=1 Tax=Nigerium massiliense TaxID=1522317 RepID=UPI0011C7BB04|nr:sugar-binding domain-containing protein [Nigerium massiliense]
MPTVPSSRPSSGVDPVMVEVARLYYDGGLTHREVAEKVGLSRVKVTRLLAEARRVGVVTIEVHDLSRPFSALEERLVTQLGLEEARVAAGGESRRHHVAVEAGSYLGSEIPRHECVAFGVSTAVAEAVASLTDGSASGTMMVPACGGWAGPGRRLNPDASAFVAGRRLGAESASVAAPLVASSADAAAELTARADVAAVLDLARSAGALVVGTGVSPAEPTWSGALLDRAIQPSEREHLIDRGAAGDICGRFFDSAGAAIEGPFDQRVVGLTLGEMRAIPRRVLVVEGRHKVPAVLAALRGGLLTTLITDRLTAEALLADAANG